MDISVIMLIFIVILAIAALIALLTRGSQSSSRQGVRKPLLSAPMDGTTDPHKSGLWYTSNWFAGEKLNEAIMEGKARYARQYKRQRRPHS